MMLRLRRKSRTERVAEALKDAAAYTERIANDKRLRHDLKAAVDHGALAAALARRDVRRSRGVSRIAADARLRKSLRAVVDDLESATGRMRRKKKSHRVRNVLLVAGGTGAAVAAAAKSRRLIQSRQSAGGDGLATAT